jgi:negative regulator of flagellin synthesis FlgM
LSSKAQVKDMAEKPPLDIEAVGRIKEAIANGAYPIDLDQISNKLFENYLEMRK